MRQRRADGNSKRRLRRASAGVAVNRAGVWSSCNQPGSPVSRAASWSSDMRRKAAAANSIANGIPSRRRQTLPDLLCTLGSHRKIGLVLAHARDEQRYRRIRHQVGTRLYRAGRRGRRHRKCGHNVFMLAGQKQRRAACRKNFHPFAAAQQHCYLHRCGVYLFEVVEDQEQCGISQCRTKATQKRRRAYFCNRQAVRNCRHDKACVVEGCQVDKPNAAGEL